MNRTTKNKIKKITPQKEAVKPARKLTKKTGSSFVAQAAILAGAGLLSRLIGFAYKIPMFDGMLGERGTAIYSAGYSIYNFLLVISSAGLPAAISRMVSSRLALYQSGNAYRVFRVSLLMAGAMGILGSFLLFFGAGFFADFLKIPDAIYSIRALAPTVFVVAVMSVFRGYFQGMSNMVPTASSQIVEQIVNAVFSIFLVFLFYKTNIAHAAGGGNAATGIGAVAGMAVLFTMYKKTSPEIHADIAKNRVYSYSENPAKIARELVKTAFPIIAGTAVFSFTTIIDSSMAMSRLMHNGAFNETQSLHLFGDLSGKFLTITTLPVSIATSFGVAAIPSVAAAVAKKDNENITARTNMAVRMAMAICVPSAFGIGIFADQIVKLLFPSAVSGTLLLQVGFISIIFLALNQICTAILQGMGQMKIPVFAAIAGCLVKIVFNYILIAVPSINILGAVIGTIACYAVASPINMYFAYKFTGARPDYIGIFVKPIVCSLLMSMVCYVSYFVLHYIIGSNLIALIISILVGVVFYFLTMAICGGIGRQDFDSVPMGDKMMNILYRIGIYVN